MKNKKFIYKSLMILLGVFLVAIYALVPFNTHRETSDTNWMLDVNDNMKIKNLSIPGTHDSGATHSLFDVSGKCQDLDIKSQLNIGVRFFDIRLEMRNNKFHIVHSFVDQKLTFKETLEDFVEFIKKYPSEFLIVSIKKENDSKNSSYGFEECLLKYFNEYKEYISYDNELPELVKDARGKIYILSRYNDSSIGIPAYNEWQDDTTFTMEDFYVQDNYCIEDINEKVKDISDTIKYTQESDKYVLNFTSCYLDNDFPPSYATKAACDINNWLLHYYDNKDKLGILIVDYASEELIELIYKRNF